MQHQSDNDQRNDDQRAQDTANDPADCRRIRRAQRVHRNRLLIGCCRIVAGGKHVHRVRGSCCGDKWQSQWR